MVYRARAERLIPLPIYLWRKYSPLVTRHAASSSMLNIEHEVQPLKRLLDQFCNTERRGLISYKTLKLSWGGHLNFVEIVNRKSQSPHPSRKTLILCHGLGSGLGFFFPNYDYVADNFDRILAVDWPGMGNSSRTPQISFPYRSILGSIVLSLLAPFSPHLITQETLNKLSNRLVNTPTVASSFFVDSLHELCQKQLGNNERIVLVGHSLGGYLAGRFTSKYPDVVDALVLVSPVGVDEKPRAEELVEVPSPFESSDEFRWFLLQKFITMAWGSNVTPQLLVRMVEPEKGYNWIRSGLSRRFNERWKDQELRAISDYLFDITVAPPLGEYSMNSLLYPPMRIKAGSIASGVPSSTSSRDKGAQATGETNRIFAREPLTHLLTKTLSKVYNETQRKVPVLLLYGDNDWLAYQGAERDMKSWRDLHGLDATFRLIRNAGHHIYMDNPHEFHQSVMEWLAERGLGPTKKNK